MSPSLLALVHECLMPALAPPGFMVAHSDTGRSFDDAMVTLAARDLRVRIVRDRNQLFADFGPVAEPNSWFESAVILDYLGLSAEADFHDRDARAVLRDIGSFVNTFRPELAAMFSSARLAKTTDALTRLKKVRAEMRFGV
jgi:hypothetical protein